MSGDSIRLALPLPRFAANACEAGALYDEFRKPLIRYLVCLGLSADEAQDVVQDTFLKLHRHLLSGGDRQNIRSWLFRVAHNHARNRQSRHERKFAAPLDAGLDLPADASTPETAALENERFRQLHAAIRLLAPAERECLFLRAGGLRYREIGEVLGIPTSTVADMVERAIRKLAEKCNV